VEEIEAHIFACCFKWVGYSVSIHLIEYGQARRVETSAAGVGSARIGVKQYVAKKHRAQRIHHRVRHGQGPISRKACSINLYIYKYIIYYIYIISVGVSGSWGLVHIPAISNTSAIHQNTFSMYDI